MKYKFKAVDLNGNTIEDIYVADSKEDVIDMIRSKDYLPLSIEENSQIDLKSLMELKRVKLKDLVIFCRLFYSMLDAGVSISSALEIVSENTSNRSLSKGLRDINKQIHEGSTLSQGMDMHRNIFPMMFTEMVKAGEISGNLEVIINRLGNFYERQNRLENKIKGSLIYPIILIVMSILVIAFMLTIVFPVFYDLFSSNDFILPLPTRILIFISNVLRNNWLLATVGLLIIVLLLNKYLKTRSGRIAIDFLKLRIPYLKGIYIKTLSANFTRTLSILLSSGIPLLQALEIVSNVLNNRIIKDKLDKEIILVEEGKSLSSAIKDLEIFPSVVHSMVKVGEESGSLDEMLLKTSEYYDEDINASLENLTKLIEPGLMIVIGSIIGFIVLALALPLFNVMYTI